MSTDSLNNSLINLCGGSRLEIEIQSEIFFFFNKDLTNQVQKATQHISIPANWFVQLHYCLDWFAGYMTSAQEKAADLSLESEDKHDATRKWVWIYAFIIGAIRDNINVKKNTGGTNNRKHLMWS